MWNDVEKLKAFKTELLEKAEDSHSFDDEESALDDLIDPEVAYKVYNENELVLFVIFSQIMTLVSSIQLRIQALERKNNGIERVPDSEAETNKIWD